MTKDEQLRKHLGVGITDINTAKLTELLVDSFIYHEGMANVSLNTINNKSLNDTANSSILWDAFETNNSLAFAMRHIILKSTEAYDLNENF